MLADHPFEAEPTLEDILRLDAWARREAAAWIARHSVSDA